MMRVGLKELRETKVWLSLVKRKKTMDAPRGLDEVLSECDELIAIFVASIRTATANRKGALDAGNGPTPENMSVGG